MKEDIIQIQGLAVSAYVGVPHEERSRKQKLLIDVQMHPRNAFDSLQEDIALTADYDTAAQRIRSLCEAVPRRLIETLASEIATTLLEEFPIQRVTIRIRKFILLDTEFVAVQTTRERSH